LRRVFHCHDKRVIPGQSIDDFDSPLFIAWQVSNRCAGCCLACCEESGPDKAWPDELSRDEALSVARKLAGANIPYVAFGGGEPLMSPHIWDIFSIFSDAGSSLKIETDGGQIDDDALDRLAELRVDNVQISVDGATPAAHAAMRPDAPSFDQATGALRRLAERGIPAEMVFVPTRQTIADAVPLYDLATEIGCDAFVTGPLMRLGRAAATWDSLAPDKAGWEHCVIALRERQQSRGDGSARLSIYPWDIEAEIQHRLQNPQAMMLIVPNGRVKLLNALPFSPADLRVHSMAEAWAAYRRAWRAPAVADFISRCRTEPELLRHANECWPIET
jgi:MoaA/NifB/PqqE/SkfB family radical SAM enzyme